MNGNTELPVRPVTGKDKRGNHDRRLNKSIGKNPAKLDPRQQLFVRYYLETLNGYQSALRAGYSDGNARQATVSVLTNPAVHAEVTKRLGARFRKLDVTVENVLQEIARMAFSNVLDFVSVDDKGDFKIDLTKVTRDQAAGVSEIFYDSEGRPRVKLIDKRGSLELLARYLKLLGSEAGKGTTGADGETLTIQGLDQIIQQVTINQTNITVNQLQAGPEERAQLIDAQLEPELVTR